MSSIRFNYEPFYYNIDRIFDEVFTPRKGQVQRACHRASAAAAAAAPDGVVKSLKPRMDLHEDDEQNIVTATFELPGVSKDDIQIDVQNGKMTVSAETQSANENGYAVRERLYGKYARTLQLPRGIKDEQIKAAMENGVLTVTFPKSTPELAPKRITIS